MRKPRSKHEKAPNFPTIYLAKNPRDYRDALQKNDARKQGLAWLVKSQSVVSDDWLRDKLEMGHRSNVSRAVRVFREGKDAEIKKMRKRMLICTDLFNMPSEAGGRACKALARLTASVAC